MKTLFLDIETAPNLAHVWSLWNQNVSLSQLRVPSYVLCWAAKWSGSKKMYFGSEWSQTDYIQEAYDLLGAADSVVSYNGNRFDLPTLNKEFAMIDLSPPEPYVSIDLYKTVRKNFKFASSKLDHVTSQLGVGSKVKHSGHDLWVRVLAGDPKAQKEMERYNKQDVVILEGLYEKLLPWISVPFNSNGDLNCGRCAGRLTKRGFYRTTTASYQTYRCSDCGGYSRDTRRSDGTSYRPI